MVLLALWVGAAPARAAVALSQQQQSWLQRKGRLVFASDSAYPPYTFLGADGQMRGLDIDVARAVGRLLAVPVEFRMLPWEEAVQWVLRGQADALAGMTHTQERLADWAFAEPHASVSYRLFVREDTQIIHELPDLEGMRVGVSKGSLVEPLLRANPKITVVNYPRREATEELLSREIMAFAGNWLVQSHFIQSHGIRGIKVVGDPLLPPLSYGMAAPKGQTQLLEILNTALRQLRQQGELAAIQRKWLGELLRPPLISHEALRRLWIGLGIAAALALLGLLRAWELRHIVRRKTARIAALRSLGHGLGEARDAAAVLERALSVLGPLMPRESLFVLIRDDTGHSARVRQLRLPESLAQDLRQLGAQATAGNGLVARVLRQGQAVALTGLGPDTRLVQRPLLAQGFRSAVCLPVKVEGNVLGVLGILSRHKRLFASRDPDFQHAVAAELGIALANAKLVATLEQRVAERTQELNERNQILEADLRMAREVQLAMLPFQDTPVAEIARSNGSQPLALNLYNRYNAARTLGGDFFDVLRLSPSQAGVFICDVMGQGARAALLTAILRALLGDLSATARQPDRFLGRLNTRLMDVLKTENTPIFASAFYACFDLQQRTLVYSNAGHPWPFLLDKRKPKLESLGAGQRPGPALGLFRDAEFPKLSAHLAPQQSWLLYTDGLYETCDAQGQSFGIERVRAFVDRQLAQPAPQILDGLIRSLAEFCGTKEIGDDVCLVAVEAVCRA